MSKAYKCDICGSLFEDITGINIDVNRHAYLELSGTKYDVCPNCINTIQSTINGLRQSDRVDIGCDSCKYSPVNEVDYVRCHRCSGYNLWEAKE